MRSPYGNKIKYLTAVAAVFVVINTQGCATKFYGRQDAIATHDKELMFCEEIELEVTKTREFIDQVNKKSAFSALDVLAILIDFGIGNYLERISALDSANTRMAALERLRVTKQCVATSL